MELELPGKRVEEPALTGCPWGLTRDWACGLWARVFIRQRPLGFGHCVTPLALLRARDATPAREGTSLPGRGQPERGPPLPIFPGLGSGQHTLTYSTNEKGECMES